MLCCLDSQATRRSAALPTPYVGVCDTGDDDSQGQGQRLSRAERIREQQLQRNRARTAKKQDEDVDPMVSGQPGICRYAAHHMRAGTCGVDSRQASKEPLFSELVLVLHATS